MPPSANRASSCAIHWLPVWPNMGRDPSALRVTHCWMRIVHRFRCIGWACAPKVKFLLHEMSLSSIPCIWLGLNMSGIVWSTCDSPSRTRAFWCCFRAILVVTIIYAGPLSSWFHHRTAMTSEATGRIKCQVCGHTTCFNNTAATWNHLYGTTMSHRRQTLVYQFGAFLKWRYP